MKVFLSRDIPSEILVNHATKYDWELVCFSCIQKTITTSESAPEADWIFFYSPGAVSLFANNFEQSTHRLAALSEGTAQAMQAFEMTPDFIGSSSKPSEVVKEFARVISTDQTVVQARGEKSFERLREVLSSDQIIDWPFYRSDPSGSIPMVEADYYIFTSPSNAVAYLTNHTLPKKAVAVVFGESTKKVIQEKSKVRILTTDAPGEEKTIWIIAEDQDRLDMR